MNRVNCDLCIVYVHRKSLWKHIRSNKHISNQRYEQVDIYNDIVEIQEWLFREERVRGFVNPFHSITPLSDEYDLILNHPNTMNLKSELKVVGKYNQYLAQVHINNIVKQMAIKYGELVRQFHFEIKIYANVGIEKYLEDAPIKFMLMLGSKNIQKMLQFEQIYDD